MSPDRARQIEALLVRMVQTGQLRGRVSEQQLIELLDQVSDVVSPAEVTYSVGAHIDRRGAVQERAWKGFHCGEYRRSPPVRAH